jgi:hypothetical protein
MAGGVIGGKRPCIERRRQYVAITTTRSPGDAQAATQEIIGKLPLWIRWGI